MLDFTVDLHHFKMTSKKHSLYCKTVVIISEVLYKLQCYHSDGGAKRIQEKTRQATPSRKRLSLQVPYMQMN